MIRLRGLALVLLLFLSSTGLKSAPKNARVESDIRLSLEDLQEMPCSVFGKVMGGYV